MAGGTRGFAAAAGASAHVFVAELGEAVELEDADAHHLGRVLRLRPGERVTLADGAGTWRPYVIRDVGARRVRLEATGVPAAEPELVPGLAVAFSLTKGAKADFTVEKLTELGVDRILPVLSRRSVARPAPARAEAALRRWRRVAREAARQSRRARLPRVESLAPLAAIAGHPAIAVCERGGEHAHSLGAPPGGELLVVVGPEGGWAPGEVDSLGAWARLGLGAHVLRAETAALAAAAVVGISRRQRQG